MLLNCGVGEDSWESLGLQGDPASPSYRKSVLNIHWKDWCWSWNSNTLAAWCKELTHLKRHWCWERLRAGGEGDDRGWDGWMAPPTRWTWVWPSSGSWWRTGKPGVLQSMGSQIVGHHGANELIAMYTNVKSLCVPLKQVCLLLLPVCLLLPASWEICMQVNKQLLELDMEQQTGSKSGKEYIKAVSSRSWWWTGKPGVLQPRGLQIDTTE